MSTPNPNDSGYTNTDPNAPIEPSRRGNSSALLWILLLVALLALAWWWYGKQAAVTAPTDPAAIEEPVAGDATTEGTADKSAVPAGSRRAANKPDAKPKAKPIAGITRDPSPLASNEAPKYPARALRSGIEGSVSVRIEVDATGVPTDVKVVERSGERSRELDRAVINTVRNWRFEPAMKNGKPTAGAVVLPVEFKRG